MRLNLIKHSELDLNVPPAFFPGKENDQGVGRRRILVSINQFIPLLSAGVKKGSHLRAITSLGWTEKEWGRLVMEGTSEACVSGFLAKTLFSAQWAVFSAEGWVGTVSICFPRLLSTVYPSSATSLAPSPSFPKRRGRDGNSYRKMWSLAACCPKVNIPDKVGRKESLLYFRCW